MYKPTVLNVNQSDVIRGGSDIYWQQLGSLLRSNGHSVKDFFASSSDSAMPSLVNFDKPKIIDVMKYVYNREAKSKIIPFLQDLDIVHLHIYYGMLTSSILGVIKDRGIPVVQTLHDFKIVCPVYSMLRKDSYCTSCKGNKFMNCAINRCNRGSIIRSSLSTIESYVSVLGGSQDKIDAYITVSDFQKNEIINMGFSEKKLHTIHNFIDYRVHKPKAYAGEYLFYFGRVEREKGISTLLNALSLLKPKARIKLIVAGEGAFLAEAKILSRSLGLDDQVEFLGQCNQDQLKLLLANCFASVAPSQALETFGLTLVESFCQERPVIASRIGGMTEIIDNEVNGLFFQPGDAVELSEHILFLYRNPSIAEKMGRQGRKKAIEKFSPQAHYRELINLYGTVK